MVICFLFSSWCAENVLFRYQYERRVKGGLFTHGRPRSGILFILQVSFLPIFSPSPPPPPLLFSHPSSSFRFGYSKGALWKCTGTLAYLGADPELYRDKESPSLFAGKSYRPETKAANDFAPLQNFISVLTQTPDEDFESEVPILPCLLLLFIIIIVIIIYSFACGKLTLFF